MAENSSQSARPTDPVGRVLFLTAHGFALLGGFIMTGLAVMVVISVSGRWLFSAPIFGDFEMVAFGTAISVFLFLPLCHLKKGNVIVDLFLAWAPQRVQLACDWAGSVLLGLIAAMLTWRMSLGLGDMYVYHESTYILAIPLWWAFPFCVAGSALLTLCCIYTALRDLGEIFA